MANALRFSVQSQDGLLTRLAISGHPMDALEALVLGNGSGVVIVSRVPRSMHDRMGEAVAAAVRLEHFNGDAVPAWADKQ